VNQSLLKHAWRILETLVVAISAVWLVDKVRASHSEKKMLVEFSGELDDPLMLAAGEDDASDY
jgi:hypothetical protein